MHDSHSEDSLHQCRCFSFKGIREHSFVSHHFVFDSLDFPWGEYGLLYNLIKIFQKDQRQITLPFSASGAKTSKIISFFSCSVCFWKRRTSSSAMLVEANCSLLDSENTRGESQACREREELLSSSLSGHLMCIPFRWMVFCIWVKAFLGPAVYKPGTGRVLFTALLRIRRCWHLQTDISSAVFVLHPVCILLLFFFLSFSLIFIICSLILFWDQSDVSASLLNCNVTFM